MSSGKSYRTNRTGQELGPGGAAVGGCIVAIHYHAILGKLIDDWRLDLTAMVADVIPAMIVGHDEEYVRFGAMAV